MKTTTNDNIINFYNNNYVEENRLSNAKDLRHKTEMVVKQNLLSTYINELIAKNTDSEKNLKIADIACGTGVHSIYLALKYPNIDFYALDIVPEHIELLNEKIYSLGIDNLHSFVGDATDLPFENDYFDLVSLAGAVYHLHDIKDKKKSIDESWRILNNAGILLIDFLPKMHGFFQQALRFKKEFLKNLTVTDIKELNCKDDVFSYNSMKEMLELSPDVNNSSFYSTDFISRWVQNDIEKFDDADFKKWIEIIENINNSNNEFIDLCEHAVLIVKKLL